MDIGHIAPLILIGIGIAAFGWGMVRISARIERRRAARHVVKYGHSKYPEYHPLYGAGVGAV
jgi:hypothetical protein